MNSLSASLLRSSSFFIKRHYLTLLALTLVICLWKMRALRLGTSQMVVHQLSRGRISCNCRRLTLSMSTGLNLQQLKFENDGELSYLYEPCKNRQLPRTPPIILLPGTAQTVSSFAAHIPVLTKTHDLYILEMRGQGNTSLDSKKATLPQHVSDLRYFIDKVVSKSQQDSKARVNVIGNSFGGRLALAFAAHHPDRVHRLSVTGVALVRPPEGRLIIKSWEDTLKNGNIRECAWSLILNGYGEEMLGKIEPKIESYIDFIVQSNDKERLYDLVRLSHLHNDHFLYSASSLVKMLQCHSQVLIGRSDRIAGYQGGADLVEAIEDTVGFCETVEFDCGHSVPFEKTSAWCREIIKFLTKELRPLRK